jgi:hypothetical protein
MAASWLLSVGFRRERFWSSVTTRTIMCAKGRSGSTGLGRILSMSGGSWIARRRKGRRAHFVAIRRAPATRPRSYRVEKRLVHVTPHPVHTALLVGPGQGMASLAEMLSGVLVL